MRDLKKLFCIAFLASLMLFPPNGSSCGPFFPDAIFVFDRHPGKPLQWYAEGNLGVVLPTFSRSYLVIAYRNFAGRPLSKDEQKAALNYWRWGLSSPWSGDDNTPEPVQEWYGARKQVLGEAKAPVIAGYRQLGPYDFASYNNCLYDSFSTAALTLRDRASRFGGDHAAIQEWIKGQDTVFSDCGTNKDIPAAVPENSPSWLKADRHYQIAAAHFYSRSFDLAAQEFDQIARDDSSPWHALAPYLAARAMIRRGTLAEPLDADSLRNAESRLQKIVNDPNQKNMHQSARSMLGYLALRLDPKKRNAELAKQLSGPNPDPAFYQDMVDYIWSLAHGVGDKPPAFDEMGAANEMTEWVLAYELAFEAPQAIERWQKRRSLPWLVLALSKVGAKDKAAGELLRAAAEVPATSPAYATVTFYRVRVLIQAGENDKARALLDRFLKSPPQRLTDSSLNLFLNQRMRLATSYQDFLARAPRPVVDIDSDYGFAPLCEDKTCNDMLYGGKKDKLQLRFDRDAAWTLNLRVPLEMLARAATGTDLPEPLRGEVGVAAWTRAVMLDRYDIASTQFPEIEKAYPAMKEPMEGYLAAKPEDRKQAALFVVLHFPGVRPYVNAGVARATPMGEIDNYRDNWWCADVGAEIGQVNYGKSESSWSKGQKYAVPKDAPGYPAFLTAEQVKSAGSEWETLVASGAGANYLTRQTLAWAQAQPQDPRIPEALHLAVRSTRYGCVEDGLSSLSKKAFTVLHEKYSDSKWAKQTPYWY
jgi:tetratricopeptide (TPR) repeat protein